MSGSQLQEQKLIHCRKGGGVGNLERFDLDILHQPRRWSQPPRLTKTFEVETSRVSNPLPVAYFTL